MKIFPAIDLFEGKAVRLLKGDYRRMTVYSDNPVETAKRLEREGAGYLHLVDLEGARDGATPNLETVQRIAAETSLFIEIGGGIRSMETVDRYLQSGIGRVILGTAAVTEEAFLKRALAKYGDQIAAGVDLKDGFAAIQGWQERSDRSGLAFCEALEALSVQTVICTDIARDGAMQGVNRALYRELSQRFSFRIIASGGVSGLEDIQALKRLGVYGAVIGKAYYTGAVTLREALEAAA